MDGRDMRIHSDHQVAQQVGSFQRLSGSQPGLCEERAQVNEQNRDGAPLWSLRSSDSDQFSRDELSTSDKLNIGGTSSLRGFLRYPSPFEGADDGACKRSGNDVNIGGREGSVLVNFSQGQEEEQATQAPENARELTLVISDFVSAPKSPSSYVGRYETASAQYQGDQPASRDVDTHCHTLSPMIETTAPRATCKRDSATGKEFVRQDTVGSSHSLRSRSQSAENTPILIPPSAPRTSSFIYSSNERDETAEVPQSAICVTTTTPSSDNEHIAKTPPCKVSLQTGSISLEAATRTAQGAGSSSLSVVSSSLVENEIGVSSTPPMPRSEPTLASPVRLGAEAKAQSTPPSSPMKLSSPPSLKPAQKINRIHTTSLGAPFRNPRSGPIRCVLPTTMSPLPPSSPPPMLPSSPPTKRPRVDSDTEDQPRPKVRRTGQLVSSPFVSPLRNAQGVRARPPAGGFSTPLRPSTIRYDNFSSPILPSQPDVFTTPATAARSSPAYRPSAAESSPGIFASTSTSYKLRPPRTVTRPFKPPTKSNRPTTATVQALRQRLQLLRNALRIRGLADPTRPAGPTQPVKTACSDEELEVLALRWRAAAQEAAQDLWALVRDSIGADSWGSDSGGSNKPDAWGWSDGPQHVPTRLDNANTGKQGLDDVGSSDMFTPPPVNKVHQSLFKNLNRPCVPRKTLLSPNKIDTPAFVSSETEERMGDTEPEEDQPKYHTLGTMLTSLGIPYQVLGWQEEEGEFAN